MLCCTRAAGAMPPPHSFASRVEARRFRAAALLARARLHCASFSKCSAFAEETSLPRASVDTNAMRRSSAERQYEWFCARRPSDDVPRVRTITRNMRRRTSMRRPLKMPRSAVAIFSFAKSPPAAVASAAPAAGATAAAAAAAAEGAAAAAGAASTSGVS